MAYDSSIPSDPGKEKPARLAQQSLAYLASGLSLLPIALDGSKGPFGELLPHIGDVRRKEVKPSCIPFQTRHVLIDELRAWIDDGAGIGIIGGHISGDLEIIDLDAPDLCELWQDMLEELMPGLLDRLPCVLTPRKGWHIYYRCQVIEGNQKLAESRDKKTLIETRGEGGYVVTPGSPLACHPLKKPYQLIRGDLTQISTITVAERQILLSTARSFNERPQKRVYQARGRTSANGERPGDLYNSRVSWHELMRAIGATATGTRGDATLWKRPGKTTPGHSAITGNGDDMLYVFSSNFAPFEPETAYDRFGAYTTWFHGGDFSAAGKELFRQGYTRQDQSRVSDEDGAGEPEHHTSEMRDEEQENQKQPPEEQPFPKTFFRKKTFIPKRLGDYLLTRHHIKYAAELLWVYENGVYLPHGERVLAAAAQRLLGEERRQNRIEETLRYIEVATYAEMSPPDLVSINMLNGRLAWATGTLQNHTPDVFTVIQLPVRYDPEATCPTFDRYLETTLDADVIRLVEEVIGHLLIPDMRYEKAVMLTGDGENGKSVFIDTLTALLGSQHVSNVALQDLEENRFRVAELFGKLGNFFADLDPRALKSSSIFKTLVTGDEIQAERKFKDPFKFRNVARLLFSANKLPNSSDRTHAFYRRWHVIPFTRTFIGDNRDPNLRAKLGVTACNPNRLELHSRHVSGPHSLHLTTPPGPDSVHLSLQSSP